MDAPASSVVREALERLVLLGLGAASLTADRAEELADALADRGFVRREDIRGVIEEARERWRGDTARLGERAGDGVQSLLTQLGVGGTARDGRIDEFELRLAQLEHRLRLVEAAGASEANDPPV